MGMAAGQARLLSITSRISDNELRAQIINNNKMRLATESSQVSEAYIAALNEAQMMFTSYDKDNNASYQRLTFNAMTAYNPYNNQYALTNSGGQVLLSELDSKNFEKANGDLETFLGLYGLEHKTTYFEQFDNNGRAGVDFDTEAGYTDLSLTGEQLEALYEGSSEKVPVGSVGDIERKGSANMTAYDVTAASNTMFNYEKALENYVTSYSDYLECIAQAEQGKFAQMLKGIFGFNDLDNPNLTDILEKLSKGNISQLAELINTGSATNFMKLVIGYPDIDPSTKAYLDNINKLLNNLKEGQSETASFDLDADGKYIKPGENGEPDVLIASLSGNTLTVNGTTISLISEASTDPNIPPKMTGTTGSTENNDLLKYTLKQKPDGGWSVTVTQAISDEDAVAQTKSIIKELAKAISNIWDADADEWQINDVTKEAYQRYLKNAKELFAVIYGEDKANNAITTDPNGDLKVGDSYKERVKNLANMPALYNNYSEYGEFDDDDDNNFKQVFCNILLDLVMDTYGEPKYAWIDKNNANENGDAKAKWYTNLFELATKNGYKTLLDGLASSSEWMQFAFENGIVQMHQIDEHNAWNNVIYSNCSDITEQTDDKAIAIAEAEYNAAMNKIENKDKRYDLELKNIDTEHNSLQVEYDSIKTAIDKNIERNFKLYS